MLYQTDEAFPPEIVSGGCHLLCFMYILDKKGVISSTHELVSSIYAYFRDQRICTPESYVIYPNRLLDFFAPGRFEYVMRTKEILPGDECLALYEWKEKGLKHFVVQRPGEPIEYDPTPRCRTTSHGELINVRVIRERQVSIPALEVYWNTGQPFGGQLGQVEEAYSLAI